MAMNNPRKDLLRELGFLAVASRLKRLSERLMQDVSQTYRDRGADFEARWFPIAYQLSHHARMSVTEIAESLSYTHPAIVQIASAMEKRGLIRSIADATDGRKRLLALTRQGRALVKRVEPTWEAVRVCTEELVNASATEFLQQLSAIEDGLDARSMHARVKSHLGRQSPPAQIVPFRKSLAAKFGDLNREWLGPLLPIEPHDQQMLDHPEAEITRPGGQILFVRRGRSIIGTVAVLKHRPGVYEIAKMAVTERERGHGIGRQLTGAAITWAREQGATEIRIATSPKLTAALGLYRSLGFVEVAPEAEWKSEYGRPTIFMKLESER
jgi:DNA-binding MarR family transcriptional regulator/GNAT superfamily N-acetyltransferase